MALPRKHRQHARIEPSTPPHFHLFQPLPSNHIAVATCIFHLHPFLRIRGDLSVLYHWNPTIKCRKAGTGSAMQRVMWQAAEGVQMQPRLIVVIGAEEGRIRNRAITTKILHHGPAQPPGAALRPVFPLKQATCGALKAQFTAMHLRSSASSDVSVGTEYQSCCHDVFTAPRSGLSPFLRQ